MKQSLVIECVVSQPFAENSYIVHRAGDSRCLIIDPGFEPDPILDYIERNGLEPEMILNTHGHVDHIAGNAAMKDRFPNAPLMIGAGDAPMLTDADLNLSSMMGIRIEGPPADMTLREGQTLDALGIPWRIREIPGHSSGHIVYLWNEGAPPIVFGGDVLFQGSIGRTDFPGGDLETLLAGIESKLYCLSDSTIVYSGHGPPTTIGRERASNPFTQGGAAGPFIR